MSITGQSSVREIVTAALRKIGVVAIDEAPGAEAFALATAQLNRMMKSWQSRGYFRWTYASVSVPLTTAAQYDVNLGDPVEFGDKPLRIINMRLKRGGNEIPMRRMTRDEYDYIPDKTSKGIPTQYYVDRQREQMLVYVWPVLAATNGETLEITYEREITDVETDQRHIDLPYEWYDAAVYGLAARLADDFMVSAPNVVARAQVEFSNAMAGDQEESVFFAPDHYEV